MHLSEDNRTWWPYTNWQRKRKYNITFPGRESSASAQEIEGLFRQLVFKLERDLLLLLLVLIPPMAILWGLETVRQVHFVRAFPVSSLVMHTLNAVVTMIVGIYCLQRHRIGLAWVLVLILNITTIFGHMYNLQLSALMLFVLLPTTGPMIFAPLRTNLLLHVSVITGSFLMATYVLDTSQPDWIEIAGLYSAIALGFMLIGSLVRSVLHELARNTAEMRAEAVKRARAEQRVADLHHHVTTLATLEHDIRQPIHAIEGYLQFLQAMPGTTTNASLLTAARAANQRANRLVSNLLEVARSSIQQSQHKVQTIHGADILASIQAVTPGLARYYNEPPATVTFAIDGAPPVMALDAEQLQRAIFNLLDNALAHTPSEGAITVHSRLDGGDWSIAVQDSGPGIPASILQALHSDPSSAPPAPSGPHLGLGLRQVYATAAAHGGTVTIDSTPHGSTVQMRLPVAPGG